MASEFLKRKAREQAERITREQGEDAVGGVKWLNREMGGNGGDASASPASTKNTEQKSKASSFLTKMAQQQAERITREQGEDAVFGVKWLNREIGGNSRNDAAASSGTQGIQPVATVSMRELADQAEQEYQRYISSDEHRMAQQTAFQQYNAEHKWDDLKSALNPLGGNAVTMPNVGGADPKEQELKAKADYYKVQAQLEADNALMMADMEELEGWSPEDRAALQQFATKQQTQDLNRFTGTYDLHLGDAYLEAAPLIQKYGSQRVKELAESWLRYQNQQTSQKLTEDARKAANGNGTVSGKWAAGAGHSALSVAANLGNSISGPMGYVQEIGRRTGRYNTLDPNNIGNILGTYASAVRGQVAENISGDQYDEQGNKVSDGGLLRQAGATLYEAGMSAADSLARIFVSSGNEALSLGLAATGSFSQTVSQASAQGANPVQAVAMGIVDGGLEVLTEKVSLDNLFKQAAVGPKNFKQILKGILKSGAIEVSEEELSFLGSTIAEAAILREKYSYNQRIGALVAQGESYEHADKIVGRELVQEAALTAVQSFLSGNMMGGGAQVVNAYRTSKIGKSFADLNLDKADIQDLIDSGLESSPDTESHQIAQEIQKQISKGEAPSNYDLARLWQANQQAMAEEAESAENEAELPGPDDVTQQGESIPQNGASVPGNAQSVTTNGQNVTQSAPNVTAAPMSVAAKIRQNQTMNGGNEYGTQQRITGPATAQLASTADTGTGTGLLHGSGQWLDGAGTGEQVGGLAGRAGQAAQRQRAFEQQRAAVNRRNYFRSLPLQKVSSAELGIQSGTDTKNIKVVPQEYWDAEMGQLAERIYQETGKQVSYVLGSIQIRAADRSLRNVNGVTYTDKIVVRADHLRLSMEQIADHEAYHGRVEYFGDRLNQEIRRHIVKTFTEEEFRSVLTKYMEAMRGVYNADDAQTGEDFERLMKQIQEEVFADAYAGINAFGAGADRFISAVNEKMEQLGLGRFRSQENGVRETNGPPTGERYSYAGENAEMADSQAFGAAEDNNSRMIYPGMDDSERAEILMQKEIRVPAYDDSNPVNGAQIIKLKGRYVTGARSILTELARQCGVFQSDFYNAEINLDFAYSNKSLKESVSKQSKRGGGAEEFGKMLTVLPEICKNAVEIEAHTDRYVETARADEHLKEMHILLGAFFDGTEIVPVQLEIKEFLPKSNQRNKLYVTVTIKEAGVTPRGSAANMADVSFRSRPASIISLSELVENVKDHTGDLVKYLPDSMLSEEQKSIKAQALEQDEARLKDMRYEFAVENQNTEKAREMLRERAAEKGYSGGNEHRMAHRAPDSKSGVSLVDADRVYGGDGSIYSAAAAMYYGEGRDYDGKAIRAFTQAYFNPDSSITVYRAVPPDIQDTKLRNGDWVSPTREYAQEHGERTFDDGYRIVSQKVPVRHLYVNGDSIHEFGYDNGRTNEVYKNTPNNVKLDEVTYDDAGNLIPLSKRYDDTNPDIRYSVDEEAEAEVTEQDFISARSEMQAQGKLWNEMFLRDRLGDEGYERYRAWEKEQQAQKKQQSREQARKRNAEKQAVQKSVTKPVAESRPTVAKRELRQTMMNLFSIPEGSRAELGTMIDNYADRLIKNGSLTEDDRRMFFDRMYDAGVMTVPSEDYFSEGREILRGGRVYVPESVRTDFGDDWNDIRRRAFGSRIYFTSDPSAGGIDMWNQELAEQLPGLFDAEETDMRSILERIVEIAEEGKDEKMSLAEYTAMLAQREYVSESEFLDSMERQMDWALRTFAEKARLEVSLRNRTGVQIAKERAEHQEMQKRQRDRQELRELQQRTLKTLRWLNQNRNRAPEELQAAFDEVLSDIDIYAVGAANEMRWNDRYNATWKDLGQMYKDAMKNDPNFLPSKELEMIVARLDGTKIADMDLGALNDLYKAAIGLRTEFYNRNNVISDEMQRLFEEVYADAKREIETAPGGYSGKAMDKLFNLEQLTPMNVLQRMGGWDPNGTFYAMAKQLEKGERDMRAYSVKAQRMLQDFLTEHAEWVKKADGQGKDGIWYDVEIPELIALEVGKKPQFGAIIKVSMTPAQKVHMYLESKNVDNLRHMTGGRTFADRKLYSEGKRQEALAQGKTVRMAPETVKAIVSDMTEQEMELARLLEQYYNSFATQEINRVSNILYGYDKAMGKNYAPIYTNRNYIKSEFGVFDSTAEGVGNLKGRQYAVNPSYNISAFDAFEKHVDQTARFVGMAIPARNWTTLMNWRAKNNSTGDVITHKWGEEGKRYITDLITTLQAGEDGKTDTVSSGISKLQSTYITAIFGANPSIVLKQLGSIPLASAYLDAQNVPTPAQIKSIDRDLIGKYTQDLAWRTMGYATPETRLLKENPNWTETNKFYKFTFGGGAITAMDGWAASVLWPWAENKVRADFPELEVGTQQQIQNGESSFYKKVAELFEDALARSQSTSDEIHQSSLRKSKNPLARAFTMFRSDSAQTYNTLRQKIGEAQYYARTGAKPMVQATAKKAVGAAFVALLMNAMWAESINFLMALWKNKGKYYRDDEDKLTFQSIAGEMASGVLGSFAGIVAGGEELLEIIGNLLTGEKIYDIETPGIEQLNDIITAVTSAGGNMRSVIAGAADVAVKDGNVWQYFEDNSGKILSSIKELAETTVMYVPGLAISGLPVSNIEGYLLGTVKWLSPELGEAYDDLFRDIGKSSLSGAKGKTLEARVGQLLHDRKISRSDETAQALAALHEAGYKAAVPSDVPASVSIDGGKHELGIYEQQAYGNIWSSIVADALDDLVSSSDFEKANSECQQKMLNYLYNYATEMTKAELFDGYEPDTRDDSVLAFKNAGLTMPQFLSAYAKYSEINSKDISATLKATEFAHWVSEQEFTPRQASVVKDELTYFNMAPASSSKYDEMVDAGLDEDAAYELINSMAELEPEAGTDEVSDLQKWRHCIDFFTNEAFQLASLCGHMTDDQFKKVNLAYEFEVKPETYVTMRENLPKFDSDGNGQINQAEAKAAIDTLELSNAEKAVLWQLVNTGWSAKNNPYSRDVGQKVLDARESEE